MDGITREQLEKELEGLVAEESAAFVRYQQLVGARQMVAALLVEATKPKLAEDVD